MDIITNCNFMSGLGDKKFEFKLISLVYAVLATSKAWRGNKNNHCTEKLHFTYDAVRVLYFFFCKFIFLFVYLPNEVTEWGK